jgi:hypothetical protein
LIFRACVYPKAAHPGDKGKTCRKTQSRPAHPGPAGRSPGT